MDGDIVETRLPRWRIWRLGVLCAANLEHEMSGLQHVLEKDCPHLQSAWAPTDARLMTLGSDIMCVARLAEDGSWRSQEEDKWEGSCVVDAKIGDT
jgi:hypothetical protein